MNLLFKEAEMENDHEASQMVSGRQKLALPFRRIVGFSLKVLKAYLVPSKRERLVVLRAMLDTSRNTTESFKLAAAKTRTGAIFFGLGLGLPLLLAGPALMIKFGL